MRVVACWLAVLLLASAVAAKPLPEYDFDSLVLLSRYIVEAEIIEADRVRVLRSYRGDLEEGARLTLARVTDYRKRGDGLGINGAPVGATDRVFVFAQECEPGTLLPVQSGIWLVAAGRVIAPRQLSSPGGYSWRLDQDGPDAAPFRDTFPARIAAANALDERVSAAAERHDVARLLAILRQRDRDLPFLQRRHDQVSARICRLLGSWREFDAMVEALPLRRSVSERMSLGVGFGTAEGREFLLARMADHALDRETRVNCATVLSWAGAVYRSELVCRQDGSWQRHGEPDEANSLYLTRLARLARSERKFEDLCLEICRQLETLVGTAREHSRMRADVARAEVVLRRLHDEAASERVRYRVARIMAKIGAAELVRLRPAGGRIAGIVRPPREHDRREEGHLACRFEYRSLTIATRGVLVLEREGRTFEIPVDVKVRRGLGGAGTIHVPLPAQLPPSRYRVFLRLYIDDVRVSDSYAWITDLP